MKTLSVILYRAFALLSLISIFIGVGEVGENLDGWHGFSSIHAFVFVLMCIMFAVAAIFNVKNIRKNVLTKSNITIGIALFVFPLFIHIFAKGLQGNVDSDFQYLILRNFQGFDKTYILLIIIGILAFVSMLLDNNQITE